MALPPFQALIDDNAADVYRLIAAMVGRHRADDCFQDTFVAALRAYRRLREPERARAWLLTIARNQALDHLRRAGRSPVPVEAVPETATAGDNGYDPQLWAAVRALPPRQRDAVVHRYVLDMSYDTIAQLIGCSPDAARRSAHEGIKKLREGSR